MHRATKPIVLAVSAVFGLGLVTAAAANAVSALAKTNGRSDQTKTAATERESHGDAVSAAAHER